MTNDRARATIANVKRGVLIILLFYYIGYISYISYIVNNIDFT